MKKRILFVTTDYSSFTQPVSKALQGLGYRVKIFDYYKPTTYSKILGMVGNKNILSKKWVQSKIKTIIQQQLKREVFMWRPMYVLVIKGETISKQTIEEITNRGIITINWYSDWLVHKKWIFENASSYSIFFCVCQNTVEALSNKGIEAFYLPVAIHPDPQWKKRRKRHDISFIGQYSKRREYYFKEVADLGLNIWGYDAWKISKLSHIAKSAVSATKTLEIIRQSKIIVNTLTGSDAFEPKEVNFRAFETTGVGTFFLTLDAPMFHKHFKVGKEIITFKTGSDLRKKARYYLHHTEKREKIAKMGWHRTKKDHSFEKRLQQMFACVHNQVEGK